ncbi:FUN14 domain-containing protein [Halorhabdus salina]|uniref:FUN14 domain-containing protein n=1 Tax=Halorhabdus salina TaxID=2750670 RepID=UPI0015EFD80C|nr:FUN14 domain-containing protein [Halorhabdus salina]
MVLENIDPTQLGAQMGGSAIVGAVIGFAAKKIAKIIAIIIGLELMLFKFLESRGVLTVNWDRLTNASADLSEQGAQVGQTVIETFVSTAGIGASFAGGFMLGFKKA